MTQNEDMAMSRQQKPAEHLNIRLEKNVADRLAQFCKDTGLTKTAAVERALDQYIKEYQKTGKI